MAHLDAAVGEPPGLGGDAYGDRELAGRQAPGQ